MRRIEKFGLSSYQFMAMTRRGVFYTFLILYMLEVLNRSFTEATLVMALPLMANSITQTLIWGPLSDKFRVRRLLIVIGESIAGVAYILLSPPIWEFLTGISHYQAKDLYALTIILGLTFLESFWSMSNVGWSALIADLTKPSERGSIMGQLNSVGSIGSIIGVFVGGFLYDYPAKAQGFHYLFFISSAIMFSSAAILLVTVKEPKVASSMNVTLKKSDVVNTTGDFPLKHIFYWYLVSIFFVMAATASIYRLLAYYIRIALLATSFEISIIRNTSSIVNFVANPIIGTISDKKGRRNVLLAGFIAISFVPFLYTLPTNIVEMILVSILSGITGVILSTVSYAFIAEIIPEESRGRYFGQYNTAFTLSFGVTPILISGLLTDFLTMNFLRVVKSLEDAQMLAITYVFYFSSVMCVIGLLIFLKKVYFTPSGTVKYFMSICEY